MSPTMQKSNAMFGRDGNSKTMVFGRSDFWMERKIGGIKKYVGLIFFNLFKIEEKSGGKTLLKVKLRKLLNYPYVLIKILRDNKNYG